MALSSDQKLTNQIIKEFRTQMLQKRLREDYIINNWIPGKLNCTKDKVFTVLKNFQKLCQIINPYHIKIPHHLNLTKKKR